MINPRIITSRLKLNTTLCVVVIPAQRLLPRKESGNPATIYLFDIYFIPAFVGTTPNLNAVYNGTAIVNMIIIMPT